MSSDIQDNEARHRYELTVGNDTAFVTYRRKPGMITFIHTEVPPAFEGQGVGSRLARHVLDAARRDGLKVEPMCPFISAWMKKHPEYEDLRAAPSAT